MKKKKLLMLIGSICLSLVLAALLLPACAPAEEPTKEEAEVFEWRACNMHPAFHFDSVVYDELCERIAEESDGRILITHYPEAQLGSWDEIYEQCMRGVIELNFSYIGGAYDINSQIGYLPFVSTDVNKIKKMTNPGGILFDILNEVIQKDGITLLGQCSEGLGGMSYTEMQDLDWLLDPTTDKRGIKMRLMPGDIKQEVWMKAMGYTVAMTPWPEVYLALQTGVIDADCNNTLTVTHDNFGDVMAMWVQTNSYVISIPMYINTSLWNSLSQADRDLLSRNIKWSVDESWAREAEDTAKVAAAWEAEGCTLVYPTDAELKPMVEFTQTEVWPQLGEVFDKKYLNMVFEELGLPTL